MRGHSTQPYISQFERKPLISKALKEYLGVVSLSYLILTAMTLGIACFPNNLFKNYVLELRFIYICKRHYLLLHFFYLKW